jgi:hypothetical protein
MWKLITISIQRTEIGGRRASEENISKQEERHEMFITSVNHVENPPTMATPQREMKVTLESK